MVKSLIALVTLMMLAAAGPSAARERETLLARALSCQIGDGEIAKLVEGLAAEDVGMKSAAQSLAAPSGNLYRLAAPVGALGYSSSEIYISPGRIVMAVSGQPPASVSARLQLTPVPDGPAERRIDGARKVIAFQLHQSALAGKVLVGCEYADPAALGWFAQDDGGLW